MFKPMLAATLAAFSLALGAHASVDLSTFDLSVKPQDDFFRYTNGTWIKNTPIPPEYSRWGAFDELLVRNQQDLHVLCERASAQDNRATPIERIVGDFFVSGMDGEGINNAGVTPLRFELDRIDT